jgi:hypothetical protein
VLACAIANIGYRPRALDDLAARTTIDRCSSCADRPRAARAAKSTVIHEFVASAPWRSAMAAASHRHGGRALFAGSINVGR